MRSSVSRPFPRLLLAAVALLGIATTAGAAELASMHRVRAFGTNTHSLQVGMNDHYVTVDGDGDTDLDCWVYDASGQLVDRDVDSTDYCILETPGLGRHRLVVRNLGDVYNEYELLQRASIW